MGLAADTQVELIVQIFEKRVAVRREARPEHDAIGEAADLRAILGQHAQHEVPRALDRAIELRHHAAGSVDQHDGAERLDGSGELRNRLFASVVVELEVVLREIEHEAAIPIAHSGIHGDDVGRRCGTAADSGQVWWAAASGGARHRRARQRHRRERSGTGRRD